MSGLFEPVDEPAAETASAAAAKPRFRLNAAQVKALSARRDGPAVWRALAHIAVVAVCMAVAWNARGTWWAIPLVWVTGYPLVFMFNMVHETAHQTAFRSRWLNYVFGQLAGFAIMLPYEYYRSFHWDHHRYTQQTGRDPEKTLSLPGSLPGYVVLMLGFPLWFKRSVPTLLRHAFGKAPEPWVTEERRPVIVREARLYLAGYLLIAAVSVWAGSWAALVVWLLPLAMGQMFMRPYLLSEHTGCAYSDNMLENTRTTYTNGFVRFFAWNMPYHAEHHLYPSVPFHALPALHELTRDHLVVTANGYFQAVAQVYRYLVKGIPVRAVD